MFETESIVIEQFYFLLGLYFEYFSSILPSPIFALFFEALLLLYTVD